MRRYVKKFAILLLAVLLLAFGLLWFVQMEINDGMSKAEIGLEKREEEFASSDSGWSEAEEDSPPQEVWGVISACDALQGSEPAASAEAEEDSPPQEVWGLISACDALQGSEPAALAEAEEDSSRFFFLVRYFIAGESGESAPPSDPVRSPSPQDTRLNISVYLYLNRSKSIVKIDSCPQPCELYSCNFCTEQKDAVKLDATPAGISEITVDVGGISEITVFARKPGLPPAQTSFVIYNENHDDSAGLKLSVRKYLQRFSRQDLRWSERRPSTEQERAAIEGIFDQQNTSLPEGLSPHPLIIPFSEPKRIAVDSESSCEVVPMPDSIRSSLRPKLIPLSERLYKRKVLTETRRDFSVRPWAKARFDEAVKRARSLPKGDTAPNIVFLQIDSLGTLDLQLMMPRTYELLQTLNKEPKASHKVFSLRKYHSVRQYTDPNVLAWMAGTMVGGRPKKTCPHDARFFTCIDDLFSLPDQCSGDVCYSYEHLTGLFDKSKKQKKRFDCPRCIQNIAKNRGYITAWASYNNKYQYRLYKVAGLMEDNAPFDLMHLVYAANSSLSLDAAFGFLDMQADIPKLIMLHSDEHHRDDALGASILDEDVAFFLRRLIAHHPNTIVLFGGDHGPPRQRTFLTSSHPYVYPSVLFPAFNILLPTPFMRRYPDAVAILKRNQLRLATPLDLYATMRHLLNFPDLPENNPPRSFSLLNDVIPETRSCADAGLLKATSGDKDMCVCACRLDCPTYRKTIKMVED